MSMIPPDAPKPEYIVVVAHDAYEQTVQIFCTEVAALLYYSDWKDKSAEVYFGKLIEVNP